MPTSGPQGKDTQSVAQRFSDGKLWVRRKVGVSVLRRADGRSWESVTRRWVNETEGRREFPLWTRALASELFPDPIRPLDADLLLGSATSAWRIEWVGRLGFDFDEVPDGAANLLGVFDGNVYMNASLLRVWATRTPAIAPVHVDSAFFAADLPPFEASPWHTKPDVTDGPLRHWLRWVLVDRRHADVTILARKADRARRERPEFVDLLDDAVYARVDELKPLLRQLSGSYLHHLLAASVGPGVIAALCSGLEHAPDHRRLLAGIGGLESMAALQALWTLSRLASHSATANDAFESGLDGLEGRLRGSSSADVRGLMGGVDALVAEVGPLGSSSWALDLDRAHSEVGAVLAAVDWLRHCDDDLDPGPALTRTAVERTAAIERVGALMARRAGSLGGEQFEAALRATEVFTRSRELLHRAMTIVRSEMRIALRELGERAAQRRDVESPDDVRLLFDDELAYYADGGLADIAELVARRREYLDQLPTNPLPLIDVRTPRPVPTGERAPLSTGESATGHAVSPATGQGRVKHIDDSERPVEPGRVLVAGTGSTSWLPRLVGAAGVVVESGSLVGHLAVLCRELGVPLVVGLPGARALLAEDALVTVNGAQASVTVVESPARGVDSAQPAQERGWGAVS